MLFLLEALFLVLSEAHLSEVAVTFVCCGGHKLATWLRRVYLLWNVAVEQHGPIIVALAVCSVENRLLFRVEQVVFL